MIKAEPWTKRSELQALVEKWPRGESRRIGLKTLKGSPSSQLLSCWRGKALVGICNYRLLADGIVKRIGMASRFPRRGTGREFIKYLIENFPDKPQLAYSQKSAWGWCDKLGMSNLGELKNGRRVYLWMRPSG